MTPTTTRRPSATSPAPTPASVATGADRPARPVLLKGNEAIAEAAIQAGCDAYFGYPITPQAELLEWMARRMPELGRVFVQAESELGAINMALGAAATGARVLVSSSSPGISLMAEAMSYMAGSELPVVVVNVMRGGPGLGSIGPAQGDYFQAVKGHGHGDYRVPVLAPATIGEAIELVPLAFELAERYRTPVMLLADGMLGQAMEPVVPRYRAPARRPGGWELTGADGREPRVVRSLHLHPEELEAHNDQLQAKFREIAANEIRWTADRLEDAEIVVVAYGTAARIATTAVDRARDAGLRAGLLRPVSLWPFPSEPLAAAAAGARAVLTVELSAGQLVEDVRLAVEGRAPVFLHGRTGGTVPRPGEVLAAIRHAWAMTEPRAAASTDGAGEPDPLSLIEDGAWRDRRGAAPAQGASAPATCFSATPAPSTRALAAAPRGGPPLGPPPIETFLPDDRSWRRFVERGPRWERSIRTARRRNSRIRGGR